MRIAGDSLGAHENDAAANELTKFVTRAVQPTNTFPRPGLLHSPALGPTRAARGLGCTDSTTQAMRGHRFGHVWPTAEKALPNLGGKN